MNTNLQTRHDKQTTVRQNMLSFTLLAVILLCTPSAFANRPAMGETNQHSNSSNSVSNKATEPSEETTSSTRPEPLSSSVEIMMLQQQNKQIHQTGDVLQLPAKEMQAGETLKIKLLDFPRRGMSMDRVQFDYGQPIAISTSVGQPPITRWTYDDRVIYFEYSTVIHVVAR